jgi:hypothetical protein
MPDRIAREHAFDLEQAARKTYADAVEQAGKARRAATDAAHRLRDQGFDVLRDTRVELLRAQPRDEAALTVVEDALREWKRSPPKPDLSAAEAEHARVTHEADDALAAELRSIRDRLRADAE